jgi:hypothetical protein
MKRTETIAPIAAALSALVTLACCLPIAFAAGTLTAGVAAFAGAYRSWFLTASVALLAIGALQVLQARRVCRTRGLSSIAILLVAATTVLLVIVFPQLIAALIADWIP